MAAYRRSRQARDLAIRAAHELAKRYRPNGEYIQAWGPGRRSAGRRADDHRHHDEPAAAVLGQPLKQVSQSSMISPDSTPIPPLNT